MRKVCLQCHGVFDTQFLCPKCGVQLLEVSEQSSALLHGRGGEEASAPVGMATRFIAGYLLALGSFYGMSLIGSGFFLMLGEENGWSSVLGRFIQPGLLMFAAVLGGMLAGAGNPRGLAAGGAIGLFHAMTVVGAMFAGGHPPQGMMLYAGWILLPLMGAIGGRYGRFIWPPLSDVFNPAPIEVPVEVAKKGKKKKGPSTPTAWFRVIGGTALAIGCTVWAGRIREYIVGTSGGTFVVDSRIQVQFVTWVIAALAIVVGGAFAGASTRAGIRHGLLVGFFACVGIFLIYSQVIREPLPAERFFAALVGLPEESENSPARIGLFLLTNALVLSVVGGCLGSTLFPRTIASQKLDRGSI